MVYVGIAPDAREFGAFFHTGRVEGIRIPGRSEALDAQIEKGIEMVKALYDLETLKEEPRARALRDFFWKVGIDPTKKRPSSEALVRRIIQKGAVPRIHPAVDAGNLASFLTFVPIGLYDMDRLEGDLVLRKAREGEVFGAIGGKDFPMAGHELVLVDTGDGTLVHQFPYRDCRKTSLRMDTRRVLIVSCGVPGLSEGDVEKAGEMCGEYIILACGGERV